MVITETQCEKKNHKFSLTKKIFREIDYLVTSLVKTLLSRNFCQISAVCTVRKNEKFSLTKKIFREINSLVTSFVNLLFSRNFCQKVWERFSIISALWDILQILNFMGNCSFLREINSDFPCDRFWFLNFTWKHLLFTVVAQCGHYGIFSIFGNNFVKVTVLTL